MLDALDQALDLIALLEVTCEGTDADEAAGMNLVLYEIESRLKVVREGINAANAE